MLLSTARVKGLAKALSDRLAPSRLARSVHDPGKTMLDLAVAIALGGDSLAHMRWSGPSLTCLVRWPRTRLSAVSLRPWLENRLRRSQRSGAARAHARNRVWSHRTPFGDDADDRQVIVELDATLIEAHSDKEHAPRTSSAASGSTRCSPSDPDGSRVPQGPDARTLGDQWCSCGALRCSFGSAPEHRRGDHTSR